MIFCKVDERRVGILIADVSGHGVPAALVASMVKVAIAAQNEHANDPAKVIAGLSWTQFHAVRQAPGAIRNCGLPLP